MGKPATRYKLSQIVAGGWLPISESDVHFASLGAHVMFKPSGARHEVVSVDDKWEIDNGNQLLPVLENAAGMPFEVTRDGEVIATVTPKPKRNVTGARKAMERLLALNIDLKLAPGETIKDIINEGRK